MDPLSPSSLLHCGAHRIPCRSFHFFLALHGAVVGCIRWLSHFVIDAAFQTIVPSSSHTQDRHLSTWTWQCWWVSRTILRSRDVSQRRRKTKTPRRHGSGGGGCRCSWFGHDTCVASGRTQSDAVGAKPQGWWDVGIRHRTKRHVPILANQLATRSDGILGASIRRQAGRRNQPRHTQVLRTRNRASVLGKVRQNLRSGKELATQHQSGTMQAHPGWMEMPMGRTSHRGTSMGSENDTRDDKGRKVSYVRCAGDLQWPLLRA
mmetsp:Transcript_7795/g.48337  ORF Transcript_7795/g.48337 Transcript_7795/m.48337 type:complete len:262 (-) Transcript_7795:3112-3897(-)